MGTKHRVAILRPADSRGVVTSSTDSWDARAIDRVGDRARPDAIDTVSGAATRLRAGRHAGLRRRRKQRQGIKYYSELRALPAAERADVALVLFDASEGIVEQDLAVADIARKAGCSTLAVLSK